MVPPLVDRLVGRRPRLTRCNSRSAGDRDLDPEQIAEALDVLGPAPDACFDTVMTRVQIATAPWAHQAEHPRGQSLPPRLQSSSTYPIGPLVSHGGSIAAVDTADPATLW